MSAQLVFNDLIKQISVLLKKECFKKQANVFHKQQHGNWILISFQKSVSSTSSNVLFTINFGICSRAIIEFIDPEKVARKITISNCQWQVRPGYFMGNQDDIWWAIHEETDLKNLVQEIENLLIKHALPFMEQLVSDEQLENFWRSKSSKSLSFRSKLDFAILLKKAGKFDELTLLLKQIEKETEGKPTVSFFKSIKEDLLK